MADTNERCGRGHNPELLMAQTSTERVALMRRLYSRQTGGYQPRPVAQPAPQNVSSAHPEPREEVIP
jgi:hypothetical protein